MSFEIGTRVECLADNWQGDNLESPVAGRVYVIREIVGFEYGVGLRLVGVVNPPQLYHEGFGEKAFRVIGLDGLPNFRPVVERKYDLSMFHAMLKQNENVE